MLNSINTRSYFPLSVIWIISVLHRRLFFSSDDNIVCVQAQGNHEIIGGDFIYDLTLKTYSYCLMISMISKNSYTVVCLNI